jgi:hypothetical protein
MANRGSSSSGGLWRSGKLNSLFDGTFYFLGAIKKKKCTHNGLNCFKLIKLSLGGKVLLVMSIFLLC